MSLIFALKRFCASLDGDVYSLLPNFPIIKLVFLQKNSTSPLHAHITMFYCSDFRHSIALELP